MVQSINTKVDLVVKGTSFLGLTDYGQICVGDKGFEFYNERDVSKNIQIPWNEVKFVIASVFFKGKWIPRFAIETKNNGTLTFAAKDPKKVLRAINVYIPDDRIVRSLSFTQVLKRSIKQKFNKSK